ncbi:DUF2312 domain-containing protein [Sinorhizobium meliloti]|nr:DUF2312 domain-containing protein [Sinorhizobium meliloti]
MSSDAQIRSFFQRWERLEAEKKELGDLLKDLFAEAKSVGYETKALRAAFRLKAKQDLDSPADAEFEAVVDTYLDALNGSSRATRAYARENIEKFDREARAKIRTSEAMDDNKAFSAELVAAGLISEEAHAENIALSNAVAMKLGAGVIDPETGEILDDAPRSDGGLNIVTKHTEIATSAGGESEEVAKNAVASASGPDEKRATNSPEEAMQSLGDGDTDIRTDDAVGVAVTGTGTPRAGVTVVGTESGTVSQLTKPKYVLRPNCRNPEACGGYGENHCHPCQKAMREKAEEVA